jgi:hypothetical protein
MPPDINKTAAKVGCPAPTRYDPHDSTVREAMACKDGRRIFTFSNNDDRDSFRKRLEQIGATFQEGDGYLVYNGDA